jgi:hypothetical protein
MSHVCGSVVVVILPGVADEPPTSTNTSMPSMVSRIGKYARVLSDS